MHERIRRHICRATFIGTCLVPTLAVLAWSIGTHWPGRTDRYARELSDRTDLAVSLDTIRHPNPGLTELIGLNFADQETGAPVLQVSTLKVWETSTHLSLVATKAEIGSQGLGPLWQLLARQLQSSSLEKIQWAVGQLEIQGESLADVRIHLEPTELGSQAILSFQTSPSDKAEPIRLRVIRNRQTSPPTTAWELVTGGNDLASTLVAAILPEAKRLGVESHFRGRAWAKQTATGWEGELSGDLHEVDLEMLLGETFPHQLTGKASINIEQARFRDGRLVAVGATVFAGPGRFSRSLVVAAATRMGLAPEVNLETLQESEAYGQLGLAFRLDARGFVMKGVCNTPTPDAALVSPWGIVLKTQVPQQPLQPLSNLVEMVSQAGSSALPLTERSEPLAKRLPLSRGEEARPTRTAREP